MTNPSSPCPYPFPEVIDSSMMGTLKSCGKLFENIYVSEWKPKEQSVHLHAGKSFARGIEIARKSFYVSGLSADDSISEGLRALLESYGDYQCPPDSAKSAERTAGAYEFYFSHYPLGEVGKDPIILPSGRVGIEFTFAHPLPINHPVTGNPLIYSGSLDALLNYAGGVFICDEKTASRLGATWGRQWDLRSQFTGYAWGCREAGIRVDGAIVRGVSILKTKYDTQEAISYRPQWMVDRWFDETMQWIERAIFDWKRNGFLHNLDHSCAEYGGCAFRTCCSSQDPTPWLESYFQRRHWDPIRREEVVL